MMKTTKKGIILMRMMNWTVTLKMNEPLRRQLKTGKSLQ